MTKKLIIFSIISIIFLNSYSFASKSASQVFNTGLPLVLEIEKIIVEGKKYDIDEFMTNIKVVSKNKIDENTSVLELTPVSVKIKTNSSSPIVVYATFETLKHSKLLFKIKDENLSIYPTSIILNNPYNHIQTDNFIPYAIIDNNIKEGEYDGVLTFTLGTI